MLRDELKFKTIKVSQKGQISIPSDIRKDLGIKRGEELLIVKKGDKLLIEKSTRTSRRFEREFDYMLRHAEKVAKELWGNKDDEIWDKL